MTTLIFIRHGQSVANQLRVFAGQKNFDLTDLGLRQAERCARFLKENFSVDAIYASDLTRARQTAEPAAKLYGLDIVLMEDLRERSIGIWAGKSHQEVKERYPKLFQEWRNRTGIVPEGAENDEQLLPRVCRAEARILAENKGKTVAVYTHAGVISSLSTVWKKSLPEFETVSGFGNASVTALEYDSEGIARHIVLRSHQDYLGKDMTIVPENLV